MNDADIMREKQRRAELKAQGIDPDTVEQKKEKKYDETFLQQYQVDYGDEDGEPEEEKKEEEPEIKPLAYKKK